MKMIPFLFVILSGVCITEKICLLPLLMYKGRSIPSLYFQERFFKVSDSLLPDSEAVFCLFYRSRLKAISQQARLPPATCIEADDARRRILSALHLPSLRSSRKRMRQSGWSLFHP